MMLHVGSAEIVHHMLTERFFGTAVLLSTTTATAAATVVFGIFVCGTSTSTTTLGLRCCTHHVLEGSLEALVTDLVDAVYHFLEVEGERKRRQEGVRGEEGKRGWKGESGREEKRGYEGVRGKEGNRR